MLRLEWGLLLSFLVAVATPAAENSAGGPLLSVTLRGVGDGRIKTGEPVLVAVRLDAPVSAAGPLRLAPSGTGWPDAVVVELADEGDRVVARANLAGPADPAAVNLGPDAPATGLWLFPEETLRVVPAGSYRVRARLSIRDGDGWRGSIETDPVSVAVERESAAPDRVVRRAWARANVAIIGNDLPKAAQIVDEVLGRNPDSFPLLLLRGHLCLAGGDVASAQKCLARLRALAAHRDGHPSVELHELGQRILGRFAAGEASGVPAAWTRLPVSVTEMPRSGEGAAGREVSPVVRSAAVDSSSRRPAPGAEAVARPAGTPTAGTVEPAAALSDREVRADPAGRWAAAATAGSQYGKTQYAAAKAAGAPDVPGVGNSADAWCPANKDTGLDWLEVTFAPPAPATGVRVRQTEGPGAIVKVEAIAADGTAHVWWEGKDPYVPPAARDIAWFAVRVPPTPYAVARIKLTLHLAAGPGWKQIDAVQLVTAP